MSKTTTLTSKGQVTIPKEIRDELGLRPYDKVTIVSAGNGKALLSKAQPSLEDIAGVFPALGKSLDEIDQFAKEAREDHYAKKHR